MTRRWAPALRHAATVLAFGVGTMAAQTSAEHPTDWRGNMSLSLKLDLPKRWEVSFSGEGRFVDGITEYRGTYLSGDVSRGIGKKISLLAGYRAALLDGESRHRIQLGAAASRTLSGIDLGLRILWQFQTKRIDEIEDERQTYLRVRLSGKSEISQNLSGYLSVEPAFQFGSGYFVDSWRDRVGLRWQLTAPLKADVYYVYRPDFSKSYNRTLHTVGLDLEWTIGLGKAKKE